MGYGHHLSTLDPAQMRISTRPGPAQALIAPPGGYDIVGYLYESPDATLSAPILRSLSGDYVTYSGPGTPIRTLPKQLIESLLQQAASLAQEPQPTEPKMESISFTIYHHPTGWTTGPTTFYSKAEIIRAARNFADSKANLSYWKLTLAELVEIYGNDVPKGALKVLSEQGVDSVFDYGDGYINEWLSPDDVPSEFAWAKSILEYDSQRVTWLDENGNEADPNDLSDD